ncbi:hypothetical protein MIMGU_mgv1a020336mg, partial [Erythranthe guttata]
ISPLRNHDIFIYNDLLNMSPVLSFHCASKNDDFGNKTLHQFQHFSWSFRTNIWSTTLYFCRFQWGSKHKGFDAFDAERSKTLHTYNYVARGDGFYVSNDETNYEVNLALMYPWE